MQYPMDAMACKNLGQSGRIRNIRSNKFEIALGLEVAYSRFFEGNIIVAVEIVDPDDCLPRIEQSRGAMHADETSDAGDKDCHCDYTLADFALYAGRGWAPKSRRISAPW